jgi:hypothetical protein
MASATMAPLLRGAVQAALSNVTATTALMSTAAPSAAPADTVDACTTGNCPIVVTVCVLYVCVCIQCSYEYTCNRSPVKLISNLQLALGTQVSAHGRASKLHECNQEFACKHPRACLRDDVPCLRACVCVCSLALFCVRRQAVLRAAATIILFAVPVAADAVQWRLAILGDIPGLMFCTSFVLFCTSAMAEMFEVRRFRYRGRCCCC